MPKAKRSGGTPKQASRIASVRLDPEVEVALQALMDRGGGTRSQAIRDAILAAAAPDRLALALAALERIEARLAAMGKPAGAAAEVPAGADAPRRTLTAPGDMGWLPEEER